MVVLRSPAPGPGGTDSLLRRFAAAVRVARQRVRLTQRELSDKLAAAGTPTPTQVLSAYENGHREPSPEQAYSLEEVLDLPEGTLLLRLRGSSPEARDLYARFSPESLCYVTTMAAEHVHVGRQGAVERIEVTRRIRALREMRTCFVVYDEATAREAGPGRGEARVHPRCRAAARRGPGRGAARARHPDDRRRGADRALLRRATPTTAGRRRRTAGTGTTARTCTS